MLLMELASNVDGHRPQRLLAGDGFFASSTPPIKVNTPSFVSAAFAVGFFSSMVMMFLKSVFASLLKPPSYEQKCNPRSKFRHVLTVE